MQTETTLSYIQKQKRVPMMDQMEPCAQWNFDLEKYTFPGLNTTQSQAILTFAHDYCTTSSESKILISAFANAFYGDTMRPLLLHFMRDINAVDKTTKHKDLTAFDCIKALIESIQYSKGLDICFDCRNFLARSQIFSCLTHYVCKNCFSKHNCKNK